MNMFKSVYMKQVMFLFSIVIIFALIVAVRGSNVLEGGIGSSRLAPPARHSVAPTPMGGSKPKVVRVVTP